MVSSTASVAPRRWVHLVLAVCAVLAIPLAAGCLRSAVGSRNAS